MRTNSIKEILIKIGWFSGSFFPNKLLLLFPLIQPFIAKSAAADQPKQPNVILILTDDQGYGDGIFFSPAQICGCYIRTG